MNLIQLSLMPGAQRSSSAPAGDGTSTSPPTLPATPAPTATQVLVPVERSIGILSGATGMDFYDRKAGERFIPRDANYHGWVSTPPPGQGDI